LYIFQTARTHTPPWPRLALKKPHKCPQAANDVEEEDVDVGAAGVHIAVLKTVTTASDREAVDEVALKLVGAVVETETAQVGVADMLQRRARHLPWDQKRMHKVHRRL